MQLVLGKNALEINEYECLPNFELKCIFLENLGKQLALKSTRKRIDVDFERVPVFAHWRGSQE